jgi:D-3-phosphoglycerate dehydrogenase
MPTIAVSTSSFARHDPHPLEQLRDAGYEVRLNPHGRKLRPAETAELLDGIVGLVAGTETLDRQILTAATDLRAIARCGVGVDNVDHAAAAEQGIAIRSTPEPPAEAVAELTLAGILGLLRHLPAADRDMRRGKWHKPMGNLLRGRTIGLVGLGRVGKRLVELLTPFACPILATDPVPDEWFAERHGIRYVEVCTWFRRRGAGRCSTRSGWRCSNRRPSWSTPLVAAWWTKLPCTTFWPPVIWLGRSSTSSPTSPIRAP